MTHPTTPSQKGPSYQPSLRLDTLFLFGCLLGLSPLTHALEVLSTLRPVYAITQAVVQNVGTTSLLLPDHASEHHYHLKPSDRQKIESADIIIWVGPELESFLEKPLTHLKPSQAQLALLPHAPIQLPLRKGYDWRPTDASGYIDPHAWLHPKNAIAWAETIADFLSQHDPKNATQYHQNAAKFKTQVQAITLPPHAPIHYLVYHDAFQYFDLFAHTQSVAPLHVHLHGVKQSQHLLFLEHLLQDRKATCITEEPFVLDPLVKKLAHQFAVPVLLFDPLGIELPLDEYYYPELINRPMRLLLEDCHMPKNITNPIQ